MLWAHAVFIPVFALARGYSLPHVLLESAVVPAAAFVASLWRLSRRSRTLASAVGLLSCSGVLVHLSGGVIEMHFHFFVMVAVVALYQDWIPFLAAIGYVLVHHGVVGMTEPTSVFNHYAALNHPWKWAAIHSFFIGGISAACLVTWRLNENLYDSERRSLEAAERAQRRLALLAEASQTLAASLELEVVLQDLAGIVAPGIADTCVVYLVDDLGMIRQAAIAAGPAVASSLTDFDPPPVAVHDVAHPIARALRSGISELLQYVPEELIDASTGDERHRDVLRSLQLASAIIVPLRGRNGPLGVLAMSTSAASGRMLTADDVSLGEELGRRATRTVEHARLFAAQRSASLTLQHSLLPESLPEIPGLAIASRYSPGGPDVEIGGDWYDVLGLDDGTVAFAMGDVVGRGVPAASLMGQLRNALRAYVMDGRPPAEALKLLNRLIHGVSRSHQMATLVVMVLNPETGELCFANAGHPPPLIHSGDEAHFLEGHAGVPLGAVAGAEYSEGTALLAPGATLVLYTDGLVEDRTTTLDTGLERLRSGVLSGPTDLDELCEVLSLNAPSAGAAHDDLAVLAVRLLPLESTLHMRLPTEPSVMRPLRAAIRRWLNEAGASEQECYEVLVAACEASSNAIKHGSPSASHFEIDFVFDGAVNIVVRSSGRWRERRESAPGGRGLDIMRQFTDETDVTRDVDAIEIRMRRRLAGDNVGERWSVNAN